VKGAVLAAAMVLTIGSVIPYIRDILAGSTKPNIVSVDDVDPAGRRRVRRPVRRR